MTDNITPLFPELEQPAPTVPVWQVTFKDDSELELVGEVMMSPLTFGFYDFDGKLDSIVAVDTVKSIIKDGYITKAEWEGDED